MYSKILSHVYCISIIFYVNFNRIKQCFPITIGFDNIFFGVCVCLYIDVMNFLLSFWMAAACKTVYRFVNRSVRKDLMNSWMLVRIRRQDLYIVLSRKLSIIFSLSEFIVCDYFVVVQLTRWIIGLHIY